MYAGAILQRFSGRGHHDDETTLFGRVPVGASLDLGVIISGILIRGHSNVDELDVPTDGWKMCAPIESPCAVLVA
jgi:hypothetical protein